MISLPHGTARGSPTCPEANASWLVRNGTAWSEGHAVQIVCMRPAAFNSTWALKGARDEWLQDLTAAEAKYGHITYWDVSSVTNMDRLFHADWSLFWTDWNLFWAHRSFNQPLAWDVSSVTSMDLMFNVRSGASVYHTSLAPPDTHPQTTHEVPRLPLPPHPCRLARQQPDSLASHFPSRLASPGSLQALSTSGSLGKSRE